MVCFWLMAAATSEEGEWSSELAVQNTFETACALPFGSERAHESTAFHFFIDWLRLDAVLLPSPFSNRRIDMRHAALAAIVHRYSPAVREPRRTLRNVKID